MPRRSPGCWGWRGEARRPARRTFARMIAAAGAKIRVIPQRLGHASAATTSVYVQPLRADENPYAEELVKVLGVEG